jgi:hypothetical protein
MALIRIITHPNVGEIIPVSCSPTPIPLPKIPMAIPIIASPRIIKLYHKAYGDRLTTYPGRYMSIGKMRGFLYWLNRLLGDANAGQEDEKAGRKVCCR